MLYTNHLPKVGAMDDGIWRRFIVIPFNAKIEGKSDVKNYSEHLLAVSRPHIMKWRRKKPSKTGFHLEKPKVPPVTTISTRAIMTGCRTSFNDCCTLAPDLRRSPVRPAGGVPSLLWGWVISRVNDGILQCAEYAWGLPNGKPSGV